ncbi:MAG: acyltransferase family protein [Verrucomicrobiales bacterium]
MKTPTLLHRRCLAFDAFRGIAALAVCLFHMGDFGFSIIDSAWTSSGKLGVNLFFTLSGFLITRSILLPETWSYRRYFESRARRILPGFYIALMIVLLLVDIRIGFTTSSGEFIGNLVAHLTLTHGWFSDYTYSIMGPFWTLSHEWCFYVLMGLCAVWLRGSMAWTLPVLMLGISIASRQLQYAGVIHLGAGMANPLCLWDQFAPGILAALFLFKRDSVPRWFAVAAGLAGTALVSLMLYRYLSVSHEVAASGIQGDRHFQEFSKIFGRSKSNTLYFELFLSLGIAGIVASLWMIQQRRLDWLRKTPLLWMGKVSYSTYLYHVPILLTFGHGAKKLSESSLFANPTVTFFILMFAFYLFSGFAYRHFEEPWMKRRQNPKS